ncbi:hypothetical protein MLD38_023347 [Melastoma candidum]|uniref:Uncharacterized protein n=1 Tax=Melastoma candidum TaxID=119954 RepID=A0ACB9QM53_9MYRT|nr:hypothetical protein MLD38_023347 [Melastoma candidum]
MGDVVDPAFIQDAEHRPKLSITEDDGIPSFDLSPVDDPGSSEYLLLVTRIGKACKEWGFFQVINHGVPAEKRARLDGAARRFFEQSLEEKRKVGRDEKNILGYYDSEHTKNVRDWKEVFDVTAQEPTFAPASHHPDDWEVVQWNNRWPEYPPELREACEEYLLEMEKLARKLLELIAHSLGLLKDRFKGFFEEQMSFLRLNHYPPCPVPHLALGVGRHKDSGALTILAQDDVGGLEVKRKTDGEWVFVRPTPNALIINVGDIIQVWSNERYESVEHRVMLNSERDRYSIPFFYNPSHRVMVEPFPELVNDREPPKYRAYNWGKFVASKKRSNLMKLDVENIQIHHFKVEDHEKKQ